MAKSDQAEGREIARLSERLTAAEERVRTLRAELDARLAARKDAGHSIAQLTREASLTRQTVYNAIKRHRVGS